LIVIAMGGFVGAIAISIPVDSRQTPGQIVVIGDPTAGDAPSVLANLRHLQAGGGDPFRQTLTLPFVLILLGVSLAWLVTGSLIVSRQPGNTSGWIFSAIGTVVALTLLPQALVLKGAKVDPGSVPLLGVWASLGEYSLFVVALIPLLFLLFPNGRPPSRRWRIAEYALFGGLGVAVLGYVVTPGPLNNYVEAGIVYVNPLGIDALGGLAGAISAIGGLVAILASLATIVAVRGRFKRSGGDERQQLRWLVSVATLAGILFVIQFVFVQVIIATTHTDLPIFIVVLSLLALTIAFGVPGSYLIAIYRYHLYDLDLVVRKAVVFTLMVGAVVALYLLIAVAVPFVVIGTGSQLPAAAVAFGVAIGLLVIPVRTRARRLADKIVYGRRATPYEVLTSFSGRVGDTYSAEDVLPRMAQILGNGVGAEEARVWLLVGQVLRPEASWPADAPVAEPVAAADSLPDLPGDAAVEVRHQGELLGALSVRMPANDPLDPSRSQLIDDLASQAGLVLRNARLIEDLRASRQRLVAAQDEERRKLERNIHDGAQQQLVAQAVKLRLTEGLVERDPVKAKEMLAQLHDDSQRTLDDLRDLARGIYPPLLADRGLAAALEAQARRAAIEVTVHAEGLGRFPQDVEAAVYFSCLEALQNIAKYADTNVASIELTDGGRSVTFIVTDEGRGFDPAVAGHGTGLQGIADRLAALGGRLDVVSAPGAGTRVTGVLPVHSGTAEPHAASSRSGPNADLGM
jgi:signal transduction histidine kinase